MRTKLINEQKTKQTEKWNLITLKHEEQSKNIER
jgi:hypothetical protein